MDKYCLVIGWPDAPASEETFETLDLAHARVADVLVR